MGLIRTGTGITLANCALNRVASMKFCSGTLARAAAQLPEHRPGALVRIVELLNARGSEPADIGRLHRDASGAMISPLWMDSDTP